MKKIITCALGLMFASHTFSADVTGTALGTYKSDKKNSNFYTKTDVYISTSSRTDTGITFGADFNLSIEGNSSTDRTVYSGTSARTSSVGSALASGKAERWKLYKVTKGTVDKVASSDDVPYVKITKYGGFAMDATNQAAPVTTYAPATVNRGASNVDAKVNFYATSDTMGKLEMGTHAAASKEILHGTFVRNAFDVQQPDLAVYKDSENSLKYTSNYLRGLQLSLSKSYKGDNKESSYGAKYVASMSGLDIALGYAIMKFKGHKNKGYSVKVSSDKFSGSYSRGQSTITQTYTQFYSDGSGNANKKVRDASAARTTKNNRFGLEFHPSEKATVSYVYLISKVGGIDAGATAFNEVQSLNAVTIRSYAFSFSYRVTDAVTVGATFYKSGNDTNIWYLGAAISF